MNRDNLPVDDEAQFESLLAEYDEALAAQTPQEPLTTADATLQERLAGAQRCLRLLRRRWSQASSAMQVSESEQKALFGRFVIERELGRSGLGVVYLAFDAVVKRQVALKLRRPEVLAGSDAHRRFLREGQTAACLHHPNLVTVLEAGEVGSVCYLAGEFCPGPTLSAWRKSQSAPIDPRQGAQIVLALADAAGYLHEQGVIHRDIKPGNVLLENGIPKLTDFGLAKSSFGDSLHTRTGTPLGTPSYMAPEQAGGANQEAGFPARKLDPPHLRTTRRDVSRDLESICLKCLEKAPARRYATGRELADDLRRFLDRAATRARPPSLLEHLSRIRRQRPVAFAIFSTALLLVCALLVSSTAFSLTLVRLNANLSKARADADVHRTLADERAKNVEQYYDATTVQKLAHELNLGEIENATEIFRHDPMLASRPDLQGFEWRLRQAVHPDRKSMISAGIQGDVVVWDRSTRAELYRLSPETGVAVSLALRADGKQLWVGGADPMNRNHVVPIRRLHWNRFTASADVGRIRWGARGLATSPDGGWLAIHTSENELMLWHDTDRYSPAYITAHYDGLEKRECWGVAFSADGKTVLSSGDDHNVRVWDFPGWRKRHELAPDRGGHESLASCVAVHPAGKYYASGGYDHKVKLWDAAAGKILATLLGHTGPVRCVAFSADGKRLASGAKDNRLCVWDVAERKLILTWTGFTDAVRGVAFSPDGKWLAACSLDETVVVFHAATMEEFARFPAADNVNAVAFTPDSKQVVYACEDGAIVIRDVKSGNQVHKLLTDNDPLFAVTVSSDGSTIAAGGLNKTVYLWHRATGQELLRFDSLGGQVNCLAFGPQNHALVAALHDGTVAFWEALPAVTGK